MERMTKGAHKWALCGGWAKTPFPPQRIGSIRHLASCRHLRYIECCLTPITPPGDHMAVPIRPKEGCCTPNGSLVYYVV